MRQLVLVYRIPFLPAPVWLLLRLVYCFSFPSSLRTVNNKKKFWTTRVIQFESNDFYLEYRLSIRQRTAHNLWKLNPSRKLQLFFEKRAERKRDSQKWFAVVYFGEEWRVSLLHSTNVYLKKHLYTFIVEKEFEFLKIFYFSNCKLVE